MGAIARRTGVVFLQAGNIRIVMKRRIVSCIELCFYHNMLVAKCHDVFQTPSCAVSVYDFILFFGHMYYSSLNSGWRRPGRP